MTDSRTRLALMVALALAMAGGVAAGVLAARFSGATPPPAASGGSSSLSAELNLSRVQSEKIRPIWEEMRVGLNDCYQRAQAIDQQRQDALLKLLTPEQRERYAHINQDYADRYTALTAKRQGLFDQAIVRTKSLLDEQQKRRYESILSERLQHSSGAAEGLGGGGSAPPSPAWPALPASPRPGTGV